MLFCCCSSIQQIPQAFKNNNSSTFHIGNHVRTKSQTLVGWVCAGTIDKYVFIQRKKGEKFGKGKSSERVKNSMSWISLKLIWWVHMHLLYHVQCTKMVFTAWYGCRSSESTTKFSRSGWIYLMKLAYCSKSLLTSQIRQNFNSSVS